MIARFVQDVQHGAIDILEHTHKVLEECKTINSEYHYLNTISDDLALRQAEQLKKQIASGKSNKKRLLGVAISVKDGICVKGVESAAGSRILKGYKPPFNATCVQKCIDEGAIIIGKTAQDEFGFGAFSTNVGLDYAIPLNPFDKERSCGGSSGGAAGLTQNVSFPHVALGESTGGSIVNPASFCGVYGLAPTYGRVSRYGVIDFGNSLDKVGPIAKTVEDIALVQSVIEGYDPKDSTSLNKPPGAYPTRSSKNLRIGLIKEAFSAGLDEGVGNAVMDAAEKLESAGAKLEEVSLPTAMDYGIPVYYILATAEASTNLAKYCGMRYGQQEPIQGTFQEYFTKVRSNHFGTEVKRRVMLGTFARMAGYRDAYYLKAARVRTKIIKEYKHSFKKYDLLLSPTVALPPPRFREIEQLTPLQQYMMDLMTVSPNLAGLPHLNIPVGTKNGLPVGMLLVADHLAEERLLSPNNVTTHK